MARDFKGRYIFNPPVIIESEQIGPNRYRAKKGSAYKAQKNNKPSKRKVAVLAAILAAAIGVGAVAINSSNKSEDKSFREKIEQKADITNGLNQETVNMLLKYDEYFDNYEQNKSSLDNETVLEMSEDIRRLIFSVIKEKMGNVLREKPTNITLSYRFEKGDGSVSTNVITNKGTSNEKFYSYHLGSIMQNRRNTIPKSVGETIYSLEDVEKIQEDLNNGRISMNNAVSKLRKIYSSIEELATSLFIIDEKGNINQITFEKSIEEDKEIDER